MYRSGSNLLDAKNTDAWLDLDPAQRMKVAGSLVAAMRENAVIFARVTGQPETLIESSYNIRKCLFPSILLYILRRKHNFTYWSYFYFDILNWS